jgi:hypothetical protein
VVKRKQKMPPATGHSEDASELQSERLTDKILRALSGIRYGSVEIIVHEGRVVQIERTEKLRLDPASSDKRK